MFSFDGSDISTVIIAGVECPPQIIVLLSNVTVISPNFYLYISILKVLKITQLIASINKIEFDFLATDTHFLSPSLP
jgi:hypothetical protein